MKEFAEQVSLRGAVPEADRDQRSFEFWPVGGTKVTCTTPESHEAASNETLGSYHDGARVLIEGIGQLSRDGPLKRMHSVEHVTLLDPLDVPARLDELRDMKDGWLDGEGIAPDESGLNWFAESFEREFSDDLTLPNVFPTPEGHLLVEWFLPRCTISLEVDLESHQAEWHWIDSESDDDVVRKLDLGDSSEWRWMNIELSRLLQAAR